MYVNCNDRQPGARIVGVGTHLPERMLTSADIEDSIRIAGVDIAPGSIERATGIRSRRMAVEGINASDLGVMAAREALEHAGIGVDEVDLLIFSAASHDITEPATANIVQAKLAARNAVVFDLKNACNSVLTAMDVADSYLQAGRARVVLVVTGEMPSRVINLQFGCREDLVKRFAHLTLADAGAAVVLAAAESVGQGILATAATSRGEAWQLGTVLGFGTMYRHDNDCDSRYFQSRSSELEAQARIEVPQVMKAVLESVGWSPDSVDVVAAHQHTRKILHEIVTTMVGIPFDRVMLPLRYTGNAVSANVPLALAQAQREGLLRSGARVLLCGGSSGFSAMAMAVSW